MSSIIEILGEKKFSGSRNKELSTRLVLDENQKIQYENNLFYNVSQQDQYTTEKNNSKSFRFYGKINPIINSDVYQKTTSGDTRVELNKNIFNLNLNNWSVVILKSKRVESSFDSNGNQLYSKGVKNLNVRRGGLTIFNANLTNGLPAQMFTSKIYTENYGLYFPVGHNFISGDKIRITSNDRYGLSNGFYEVVYVDGDKIFIDTPPKNSRYVVLNGLTRDLVAETRLIEYNINKTQISKAVLNDNYLKPAQMSTNDIVNLQELTSEIAYNNDTFQNINGLNVKKNNATKATKIKRPSIELIVKPQYYVSKVVENELLEYYIKTLEVIDIIEEMDTCAFSVNSYAQGNINFFLNRDLILDNLYNNLNEPISDLYIGIIKNGSPDLTSFSSVESHFSKFINYVNVDNGIEKITDNNITLNKKVKVGDVFYHSVCEHTTENLQEVELDMVQHRFIHKDILFKYNPFYKVGLKLKSIYIEDSDTAQNIPLVDKEINIFGEIYLILVLLMKMVIKLISHLLTVLFMCIII